MNTGKKAAAPSAESPEKRKAREIIATRRMLERAVDDLTSAARLGHLEPHEQGALTTALSDVTRVLRDRGWSDS